MKILVAYDMAGAAARLELAADNYSGRHLDDPPDEKVHPKLGPRRLEFVKTSLESAAEICHALRMTDLADTFERMKENPPHEMETFHFAINQFESALLRRWLFIPSADADTHYNQDALFGVEVNDAFPSSAQEIKDAGNCLTLMQPTAAVFHLMRAMEPPLIALGREFGVTKELVNWNDFLNSVEGEFRSRDGNAKRPADWADSKDYYTDMVAYLFAVKNAWRNYTAHLRVRYTDEEAREIMGNIRSFMRRAAKRLKET